MAETNRNWTEQRWLAREQELLHENSRLAEEKQKAQALAERRQKFITECQQLIGTHDNLQIATERLIQRSETAEARLLGTLEAIKKELARPWKNDTVFHGEYHVGRSAAVVLVENLQPILNAALAATPDVVSRADLESRVAEWIRTRIGEAHLHRKERAMRLLEEAVELAQAEGIRCNEAVAQVAHVYSRPKGDPPQEAAGVAVCLLGWCASTGNKLLDLALQEIKRIEAKPIEQIRGSLARKMDADLVTCVLAAKSEVSE